MSLILVVAVLCILFVVAVTVVVGLIALGRATGSVWVPLAIVVVPLGLCVLGVGGFFFTDIQDKSSIMASLSHQERALVRSAEREVVARRAARPTDDETTDRSATEASSTTGRPAWIDAVESRVGDRIRFKIEAGPYTGLAACDRELNRRLLDVSREHIAATYGDKMASTVDVSPAWLRANVVVDEHDAVTKHAFGPGAEEQLMYRAYMLVEFDEVADRYLLDQVRQVTMGRRLAGAGFILGGILLVLITLFGYLKTDHATGQKYSGRLKLVAGSVILATVAAGAALALRV